MSEREEEGQQRAEAALRAYAEVAGIDPDEDAEQAVARLLADLHHYCAYRDVSWYEVGERSAAIYAGG